MNKMLELDVISEEKELELLEFIGGLNLMPAFSKRRVYQYGYEYPYKKGGKIRKSDLKKIEDIPDIIRDIIREPTMTEFNQAIINEYRPGEGIHPHIDSEVFGPEIVCYTLGSGRTVDFYDSDGAKVESIYTPRRSRYTMRDEYRYELKHGISGRKSDIVFEADGSFQKINRGTAYSITFRTV